MSVLNPKPNTTIAYTDGACKGNPGVGGWGTYLIFSNGNTQALYGGDMETTNNKMELTGAIEALKNSPTDTLLEIWTDSSYVKNGITSWIHGWKQKGWKNSKKEPVKNKELWQQLDTLCQNRKVTWHWVKGHSNHAGNDKADELANLGVEQALKSSQLKKKHLTSDTNINLSTHTNESNPLMPSTINNLQTKQQNTDNYPHFDGDTSYANPNFRAVLPEPVNRGISSRQLIMDTETTGLDASKGDRIIEVGIVELVGRKPTGNKLHVYINPKRDMDEDAIRIHGITQAFLADKPTFDKVAKPLYEFMIDSEIIAHNAAFDMGFLSMEFDKVGLTGFADKVQVTDSLAMAKQQYPGQRNTLDALVRRLNVGKKDRTFHGALLDAEILAEVYLAMTGGQVALAIDEEHTGDGSITHANFAHLAEQLITASTDTQAHKAWVEGLIESHPKLKKQLP